MNSPTTAVISSTGYTGPVGRELVTAASEPLMTLASIQARLRLPFADEYDDLQAFLLSATEEVEEHLGRRLLPQTWRWWYDAVPSGRVIVLPEPVRSIAAVKSYATDGASGTTLASTEYEVDSRRDRLVIDDSTTAWPPTSVRDYNAVSIEAAVGYATAADVPAAIVQAVYLAIQGHYLRGAEPTGEAMFRRGTITNLLGPYRYRMGIA